VIVTVLGFEVCLGSWTVSVKVYVPGTRISMVGCGSSRLESLAVDPTGAVRIPQAVLLILSPFGSKLRMASSVTVTGAVKVAHGMELPEPSMTRATACGRRSPHM